MEKMVTKEELSQELFKLVKKGKKRPKPNAVNSMIRKAYKVSGSKRIYKDENGVRHAVIGRGRVLLIDEVTASAVRIAFAMQNVE